MSNQSSTTYDVTVFPAILTQNLDGAFNFSSAPRDLNAAKVVLDASPNSFALSSGQLRSVSLRWNALPVGQRWVAVGIIFQGAPENQTTAVHVVARLLSVNFLRLPGPVKLDGIFTGLFPEQFGAKVLRFVARVKNLGDDFTAPSNAHLTITDSSGRPVLTEPWTGQQILPGATVDFPIDIKSILPAGHYTATVSMNFGGPRRRSVPFTLAGPNQLPTPGLTIAAFNASGDVGSPTNVSAKVISSGTAPVSVTLHLFLGGASELPGQPALAATSVTYHQLAPGSTTDLSQALGGPLKAGAYRAVITWKDPTGAPHFLTSNFTAAASKSTLTKIWDWIKNHWWLFLILLILALLTALAYLYNKQRQRQRQLEAELAAARTGGQPPSGGEPGQPPTRGPPSEPSPPALPAPPAAPPAEPAQPAQPVQSAPPVASPPASAPPVHPPQAAATVPTAEQSPAVPQAAPPPPQPPAPAQRMPLPPPPTAREAINQLRRRARRRFASSPPRPPAPAPPPAQQPPPPPPAQPPPQAPAAPNPPATEHSPWEPPPGS